MNTPHTVFLILFRSFITEDSVCDYILRYGKNIGQKICLSKHNFTLHKVQRPENIKIQYSKYIRKKLYTLSNT
jgi:hypothetical protein